MNCPTLQDLLHAYVDGELDLAHALDVEQHLQACPTCARACAELRELGAALRANLPRFSPPAGLRNRLRSTLHQNGRSTSKRWPLLALAASLLVVTLGLASVWPAAPAHDRLAQEVVDSHIRSQLASRHLLDVESSDRHEVKPWFQGKLDFAPTVRDLSADGFGLVGGRLDYVNGRPVAVVIYHRRQHVINLLMWPAAPGEMEVGPRSETRQGYHLLHWRREGLTWWAVSDLEAGELTELARLLR